MAWFRFTCLLALSVALLGCAALMDAPSNIAGFSTRSLEERRTDSVYQVYDCSEALCFQEVLNAAQNEKYHVFTQDQAKGVIVLMSIPGAVDTTQVGVFFTPLSGQKGVKVELSSRSTPAKRVVAKVLFEALSVKFNKI